ncbi:hypothetical protein PCE1_003254 [Barthelona sp. PCE]
MLKFEQPFEGNFGELNWLSDHSNVSSAASQNSLHFSVSETDINEFDLGSLPWMMSTPVALDEVHENAVPMFSEEISSTIIQGTYDAPLEHPPVALSIPFRFPEEFKLFVIKSFSEDDVFKSIRYGVWTSTLRGNQRLNEAFETSKVPIYLLFSVNRSKTFCGFAQLVSGVIDRNLPIWDSSKFTSFFNVKWLYLLDVPNTLFEGVSVESNDNLPFFRSRDTQDLNQDEGNQIITRYLGYGATNKNPTNILMDWNFYLNREESFMKTKCNSQISIRGQRFGTNSFVLDNTQPNNRKSRKRFGYGK